MPVAALMADLLRLDLGDEGQQGHMPRPLDGHRQAALMLGADPGLPTGANLAALADVALQRLDILVVDLLDVLHAELTDFAASARTSPRSIVTTFAHCSSPSSS